MGIAGRIGFVSDQAGRQAGARGRARVVCARVGPPYFRVRAERGFADCLRIHASKPRGHDP